MDKYTYKKIQNMREALKEEIIASGIAVWNVEWEKLVEMRLANVIACKMFDCDILKEVKVRDKDR